MPIRALKKSSMKYLDATTKLRRLLTEEIILVNGVLRNLIIQFDNLFERLISHRFIILSCP